MLGSTTTTTTLDHAAGTAAVNHHLGNDNGSVGAATDDDDGPDEANQDITTTATTTKTAEYRQALQRKEEEVALLQSRVHSLSAQLEAALSYNSNGWLNGSNGSNGNLENKKKKRRHYPLSPHAMNVREEVMWNNQNGAGNGNNGFHSSQQQQSQQQQHRRRHGSQVVISAQRERLGRNASIATRQALDELELMQQQRDAAMAANSRTPSAYRSSTSSSSSSSYNTNPPPIQRILDMFQRPSQHLDYLNSSQFAKDLYKVTVRVRNLLETEPRVVFLQSPAYVFGDIHGNLEDLHFFSDNVWRLGLSLTAGNFLFLGDYVDRGKHCLEVLAYLFALKLQNPHKLFLLRGNHETRDVNGWEEHYGERSFIYQCRFRFGDDIGYRVWEICNQAFDRLPLAAVIDQDIFCVHGGIPRPIHDAADDVDTAATARHGTTGTAAMPTSPAESIDALSLPEEEPKPSTIGGGGPVTTRIQDILTVPKVAGINPPYEHEDVKYQQVASDCIWSDPASEEQELTTVDPVTGYGESLRGGGAICFGHKAVTQFLEQVDCSYIMRAHEAHAEGVAVSKGARVFTVFSTSQDHNQGSHAMAGCILVDNDKLQVINRSPAYKNQYVHRRDSVSLWHVSEPEIQQRIRLGLVKDDVDDGSAGGHNHHQYHQPQHQHHHHDDDHPHDETADHADPLMNPPTEVGGVTEPPSATAVDAEEELLAQRKQEETWRDFDDTSSDNADYDDDDEILEEEAAAVVAVPNTTLNEDGAPRLPPRRESSGVILNVDMGGDYVFDKQRRSSVDLTTLNLPPNDDNDNHETSLTSNHNNTNNNNTTMPFGTGAGTSLFGAWGRSNNSGGSSSNPNNNHNNNFMTATTTTNSAGVPSNPFEWARTTATTTTPNNGGNLNHNNPFFFTAGSNHSHSTTNDTPMSFLNGSHNTYKNPNSNNSSFGSLAAAVSGVPPHRASLTTPFATIDENQVIGGNGCGNGNNPKQQQRRPEDHDDEIDTVVVGAAGADPDQDDIME